ncbi:acetyl-CoA carboxylase carboxyltransferase subunit alpha [Futiania mangrovi]|uniref:Acetyl-coenzyme A carboxylase carboxyl transferase subunit alpha n=1 Tax=Futiania mangrovi TaxID=2959716 RepID=A0A9J6PE96_9PROT|nr:acetyl-CoA carboxylase carboxyltransferase subunit alpha [Futiania mangrovii]MCP1336152.1 acetyl-CoA carboxylase carboxyltransferase subunit alpha [Futiania mangrovii]
MRTYLDFEKPIAELEGKVRELRQIGESDGNAMDIAEEVQKLEKKAEQLLKDTYEKLDPWQKTQVARHPDRPKFLDYVGALVTDFVELKGDRAYADDAAIVGGLGRFQGRTVMVIGHEKGSDTTSRIKRNFGMARPEGYRKAVRLMHLADRFGVPVVTLVDTPGAYPGIGAEERGQAEAIARSTQACLRLGVPLISVVMGEGGSGGAVALATANHVIMLEHSVYSVISPEGCASILWRDAAKAKDAATALKLTAQDLMQLNVIDTVVAEPMGGAHRDPQTVYAAVRGAIAHALEKLGAKSPDELRQHRRQKYLDMGRQGLA